ncbi:ABC transporter permease [Tellurirhabdus rosea]|uniref:ABC transporter permease n=1 Tax=Tellurirhabdus rosea TaxID=2674997 RepID=UPI002250302C|nr:ABC transporter permease [Tellurirhabdus rosea]
MFQSYLKIAWRNLWKNRVYSGINVLGLAVGLAVCALITLYVADELSFDRHHERSDRIYRVVHHASWSGRDLNLAVTSAPYAPALQQTFPEIEKTVRILTEGGGVLQHGETKVESDDIVFADASLFQVFSHPFLYGDPATALAKPQSIVLTKSLATRLFADAGKAVGQTVLFENNFPNLVTGVIEDVPQNSHLVFSGVRSLPTGFTDDWQNFSLYTYLLLKPGADAPKLAARFPAFFERFIKPEMGDVNYRMELQPLTAIHLHSNLDFEYGPNGNSQTVAIFSLIGALILLLAGINYTNLAMARSIIRVREVGVRKAVGSARRQLAELFLTETGLLVVLATGLGVVLAEMSLPLFNELTGKSLSIWRFGVGYSLLALTGFAVVAGILSGAYPALFLSGARPVIALRGQLGSQAGKLVFRKALVTFQFVITVALMAASGIIYQQLRFTLTKNLGFNKDQVLTVHLNEERTRTQIPAIKAHLLGSSLVEGVSVASNSIGRNFLGGNGHYFEIGGKMSESTRIANDLQVDGDFLNTMDIRLLQGRNLSDKTPADRQNAVLVNQTLAKAMGWTNPIGRRVRSFRQDTLIERRVVGVVQDFHLNSLQHKIEPLLLQLPASDNEQDNLYIRIRAGQAEAALAVIEKTYHQFEPGGVFNYQFLNQNFARQYSTEQKQGRLLQVLTALAIFIACLGLFGLAAFTAEQRTKEIGVRKVLGASVTSIVVMLSKDFLTLVVIAVVIACPIAWYGMTRWLQDFAYRIDLAWWMFALAGVLAVVVALLTVSFHAVKAALMNPVKSLRAE